MFSVTRVFQKVIVARFYERNTGFFLFIFFVMFGIVESSQIVYYHLSLIHGMIEAPVMLTVVLSLWVAYAAKCLLFVDGRLSASENEFLFRLALLEKGSQFTVLLVTFLAVYLPVLIYSLIVIGIAFSTHHSWTAFVIILFHIVVVLLSTWTIFGRINGSHKKRFKIKVPPFLPAFQKPFPFFYLGHLTHELKMVLVSTKFFSVIGLVGFLQIPLDQYDNRLPMLGLLFGLAAHSVIVFEFRRFEDRYLLFVRGLSWSIFNRFARLIVIYLILLIPEILLLIVNHIHVVDIFSIALFCTGFLLFMHSSLYGAPPDMDRHIQRVLGLFLASFLIVLWHGFLIESAILWLASFYIFRRDFYRYEGAKG